MNIRSPRGVALAILLAPLFALGCEGGTLPTGPGDPDPGDPVPPPPAPPPEVSMVGRIAFTSTRDGEPYVYVVEADGSDLRRLARGQSPAWSPDGQAIAFQHYTGTEWEIRVIGADGTNERRVVGGDAFSPAWSPDGEHLVFLRSSDLRVVRTDGTGEVVLVDVDAVYGLTGIEKSQDIHLGMYEPSWSPGGDRIAFGAVWGWELQPLMVVDADGSNLRRLTQLRSGAPAWSPDGSRIAFGGHDGRITSVAYADGADVRVHLNGSDPDWSPDGDGFVYSAARPSCPAQTEWGCPHRIWVGEREGGRFAQLVPDAAPSHVRYDDYQPVWSRVRD